MNVGEVREWLIRLVSKTSMAAMSSRVRIPPSPPLLGYFNVGII